MTQKLFLKAVKIQNLLSFGGQTEEIEFQPLNVFIGENASGKSNLIEVINLLSNTPFSFSNAILKGGGILEYLSKNEDAGTIAKIDVSLLDKEDSYIRHSLAFTRVGQSLEIIAEDIDSEYKENTVKNFSYNFNNGVAKFNVGNRTTKVGTLTTGRELSNRESILSQIKDPLNYPVFNSLSKFYEQIKIYKDWDFTYHRPPRSPSQTDSRGDFLEDDARNLALVLNNLENETSASYVITENFKQIYERAKRITTLLQGGTIQTYVEEDGVRKNISAMRLSDGTLRYLCLLTILCHPTPPPLICIEEPEIGLHPDILPTIAKLLIDASKRTQLIVTTHSDIIVSALSEHPEAILVCERDMEGTKLRRLNSEKLKSWLEEYSLGEMWIRGEIGGKRW